MVSGVKPLRQRWRCNANDHRSSAVTSSVGIGALAIIGCAYPRGAAAEHLGGCRPLRIVCCNYHSLISGLESFQSAHHGTVMHGCQTEAGAKRPRPICAQQGTRAGAVFLSVSE
jgi:hypothetical protein